MKFEIPASLQAEHAALHTRLASATHAPGKLGEAAREVGRLLHPHVVKEEAFALPPLGLLGALARGGASPEMREVLPMTDRLAAELPEMLAEHRAIVAALEQLRVAAHAAGLARHEHFSQALIQHALTEEEVLYPAALLVGRFIERELGRA